MKKTIFIISFLSTISSLNAQYNPSQTDKKSRREKFMAISKDSKFVGVGMAIPDFKDGWETTTPWMGLHVNLWETMGFYWYRGEASRLGQNGETIRNVGYMGGYNVSVPFPIFSNKSINFFPYVGFEANWKYLQDFAVVDEEDNLWGEGQQIGFGVNPGVSLRMGPVQLRAQYNVGAGYSFNKTNAFPTFTAYPSVSIAISSLPLLLNPREFSARGLKHYIDNYQSLSYSYISDSKTVGNTTTETKTTVTHTSWTDKWKEATFTVKDVRPFLFIGPRVSSTFYLNKDFNSAAMYGANMGFKASGFWFNSYYETGSIAFQSPNNTEQLYKQYGNSVPKLSGKFINSSRYGAEIGFDMVVVFQKSDFIPFSADDAVKLNSVTSYFSLIPLIGYGKANFGNFEWDSPTGANDYLAYSNTQSEVLQPGEVVKNQDYINLGLEMHVGAMALGVNKYFYRENRHEKQLNNITLNLSWNIPIVRMANAMRVMNMDARLQRQSKRQLKNSHKKENNNE